MMDQFMNETLELPRGEVVRVQLVSYEEGIKEALRMTTDWTEERIQNEATLKVEELKQKLYNQIMEQLKAGA